MPLLCCVIVSSFCISLVSIFQKNYKNRITRNLEFPLYVLRLKFAIALLCDSIIIPHFLCIYLSFNLQLICCVTLTLVLPCILILHQIHPQVSHLSICWAVLGKLKPLGTTIPTYIFIQYSFFLYLP